ncbi:MAG TPA: SRPBCC domain-containing protein [Gammaproteobacteria bacterium]
MRDENSAVPRMVTITRAFAAPRELVFRMWTRPELLMRWYAPRRCRLEILQFDFREGGEFRYRIHEPAGGGCGTCSAVFTKIVAPERIEYSLGFVDEQGRFVTAASVGADAEWPDRTTVAVTFHEINGRTTMTLHQTVAESVAKRTGAHPSWVEMIERLSEQLAEGDRHR